MQGFRYGVLGVFVLGVSVGASTSPRLVWWVASGRMWKTGVQETNNENMLRAVIINIISILLIMSAYTIEENFSRMPRGCQQSHNL
jgi:hypothetical protein